MASRSKPIIDQASAPSPAPTPAPKDSSDSLETTGSPPSPPDDNHGNMKFLRPLITDVSLYTNSNLGPENDEGTSLEELAHLVRLSKYQERKRANTRIRLQRSLISTALSARLMRCGEMAHRNLVDCFRGDDKKTFAALYNAVIDVRRSCDETRRYALLEPEMELLQPPGLASSENLDTPTGSVTGSAASPNAGTPFLNDLSASAREAFLHFLTQIRTNPDYLATRIGSLKNAELAALTSFHQMLEPIESVLPYHSRSPNRAPSGSSTFSPSGAAAGSVFGSGSNGAAGGGRERSAIERLLSFQRHDPISALIFTCFANSAGPDSAEDKRRTVTWANACARLISSSTTGNEQTVTAVLNVWVSMRDWAGRSNMEWYLMKILEDGAFLLDRAEDQHGTRFNLSDWTPKDQIAAEEFYTRAVDELFEVIDDEDATGIPEGLLELGNEILKRLDRKYVESTRRWLIAKYMFTVWLLGVVIHPEAYGMMAEHHITEYGRQKILKTVAMQAQKYVVDLLQSKTPVSTPPKVKSHIESIYNRFKDSSRFQKKPRLLPARSITSLRETVEVHPYLVISPADLATLVNALFPERRPQSAHSSGLRSGAPSISGFSAVSQPMSIRTAPSTFDTMSVLSTSAESSFSDATTSREPLLEEGSPRRYSPSAQEPPKPNNYEEDGYRLRLAMHEMTQTLGQDVVYGLCHPCAERWAVLFISADGSKLSTHMTFDLDDQIDEGDTSSNTSDTEGEETDDDGRPELDKDYHQLRDSILKLVQEYEIPQSLESDGTKQQTFSNRASTLKKYRSKNRIITTMGSRNPYRQRAASMASSVAGSPPKSAKGKEAEQAAENQSPLITMLTAACSQSRAQSDFVSAHLYWRTLQQLNALSSESLRRDGFAALLNIFSRGPRDSIRRSAAAIEEYDAWLVWLKQSQERAEGLIESMMRRLRALRDKMWYVTDVRNSAPYEDSRNVAAALKTMGAPRRWSSFQRIKSHMQRGPSSNYIFRTESQVLDLLAAPEEQGGPNKLRDEQAEKTARWLQQCGIENFCQGEERIHRFCCEVDSCVSKLVGDSIIDGPVLWSSELFARDRRAFETSKNPPRDRDRDNQSAWDDSFSVISDPDRRFVSVSRPPSINSRDRDLRGLSGHNMSQLSVESSRFSFSRASTAISEIVDGQEYFGASSPVHQIDPNATFWSPFQHRATSPTTASGAHSPTTSLTNLSSSFYPPNHQQLPSQSQQSTGRPGTSTSSAETVYQQRLSEEKSRFLADLRQTLTSLLLSDLGNLVFARGSETDAWFEGLGQECIDRREAIQRRARKALVREKRKSAKSGLKQRFLENNRSFGDLRGSGGNDALSDKALSETQSLGGAEGTGGSHRGSVHGGSVHGNESSATSDTISARRQNQESRKESMPDFPFTKAYQRLLKMFCVHPNPYVKLNALFELEHLIIASLNSGSRRARLAWARSELGSASSNAEEHGAGAGVGRSQPIEETIDNVKERRSQTLMQAPTFGTGGHAQTGRASGGGGNTETRSVVSGYPANTDAVANILRALFRDPSLRPKTLFRDLQFISAFVPPAILDKTERGKAFWDAGLAALNLKQEVCRTMVEVADEIVKKYTQERNAAAARPGTATTASSTVSDSAAGAPTGSDNQPSSPASPSPPSSPPSPLPLSTYSLADAARMWTITAKEGDPTAQRELALCYLSQPELVQRITLPLSKPREVFKQAVIEKYGGSGGGSGGGGRSGGLGAGSGSGRYHHHHHHHHGGGHHHNQHAGAAAQGRMQGSQAGGPGGALGSGAGGAGGGAGSGGAGAGAGAGGGVGKQDGAVEDVRSDPALMCVAIHWMEAAERGGDELARTFMAQNEMGQG
ncbi:uncharacterized protein THITE_2107809 [Thermothielavioides terrestris NRRL 8126]|uniref:Uncharacterized protein n=1 Tax=Thermothielavioides terrestris (strain ATCC 38088 / NRRL 8126) TaxID=578455 RepID=G2QVJ8_THETT|nr:uncharacterized protein THITE_2107809 [Thermothielavioides terrestris NRRL 8126]AEO62979.1 hypothetical protein THITE_2107809 [Thermothielavioides terrestris NRRL 8126]